MRLNLANLATGSKITKLTEALQQVFSKQNCQIKMQSSENR